MQINDILTTIFAIEDKLQSWLFAASAKTPEEQARMARCFALRDLVMQKANEVVLNRLPLASKDLTAQAKALDGFSERIEQSTSDIDDALAMIEIVSGVADTLASVLATLP